MATNALTVQWEIGGTTEDEGWKIVTKEAYIQGDSSEPADKEWIATVYDRKNVEYIVDMHNYMVTNARSQALRGKDD